MMEAAAKNCGLMIPQTPQLGGWLISTADLASSYPGNYMAILVGDTLYFSAYDGSSGTNCGLMIPQTPQLGGWLISDSGSGGSNPGAIHVEYSSVIRSTSVRMMEAAA